MKNLLLTALLIFLALNPFSKVVAPLTPQQCGEMREMIKENENPEERRWVGLRSLVKQKNSLASIILAECDKLEIKLKQELRLASNNREIIMRGNYRAHAVLESHELVGRIMNSLRTALAFNLVKEESSLLWMAIQYESIKVAKLTPEAFLSLETCSKILSNLLSEQEHEKLFWRNRNNVICSNMVTVFKLEIDNSLNLIKNNQPNWTGRDAELQFIEQRMHELSALGVKLDKATERRIEAILKNRSKLTQWSNQAKDRLSHLFKKT